MDGVIKIIFLKQTVFILIIKTVYFIKSLAVNLFSHRLNDKTQTLEASKLNHCCKSHLAPVSFGNNNLNI